MNLRDLTSRLDKVASALETHGYPELAKKIDQVSNSIEAPVYGGQDAGTYEVHSTSPEKAKEVAEEILSPTMGPLGSLIPSFVENYKALQSALRLSRGLKRAEMPVVSPAQVKGFVEKLRKGELGLGPEFSYGPLNVLEEKVPAKDLKPIQGQVYLDNALGKIKDSGVVTPGSPITVRPLIASKDNDIIDGHHKWAAAMLSGPNTPLAVVKVLLSIEELLKVASAYGDLLGNLKNR